MPKSALSSDANISFPDTSLQLLSLMDEVFKLPARPPINIPADQYGLQRAFHDGQRSVIEWAAGIYKQSLQEPEA